MENQFSTMDVKKRKVSAFAWLKKAVYFTLAVLGCLISFGLLFTIIGIPFSIIIFLNSVWMFAMVFDNHKVKCPHCNKITTVGSKAEELECKRCKQTTLINWVD